MDNIDELFDDELEHSEGYGPTKTSYANQYYDPQKAHEYYEAHKKLKGRTSNPNRDENSTTKRDFQPPEKSVSKQTRQLPQPREVQEYLSKITSEISTLYSKFRSLDPNNKDIDYEKEIAKIQNEISELRKKHDEKKADFAARFRSNKI